MTSVIALVDYRSDPSPLASLSRARSSRWCDRLPSFSIAGIVPPVRSRVSRVRRVRERSRSIVRSRPPSGLRSRRASGCAEARAWGYHREGFWGTSRASSARATSQFDGRTGDEDVRAAMPRRDARDETTVPEGTRPGEERVDRDATREREVTDAVRMERSIDRSRAQERRRGRRTGGSQARD